MPQDKQPVQKPEDASQHDEPALTVSRRGFLKGMGGIIAAASIPTLGAGCSPQQIAQTPLPQPTLPVPVQYPFAPPAPVVRPEPGELRFFTREEARAVDALTARMLPGTPDDPGAREAQVINYIDFLLSYDEGYHEATYRVPPYAEVYEGDTPPETEDPGVVWVPASEIERYGYQSRLTPREVYRIGVAAVNSYARAQYGGVVADLSEEQQDQVLQDLLDGKAEDHFTQFTGETFFHVLRRHTGEGMFSDPAYGGNYNMVGWQLIGYPGAQRAYTVQDIRNVDSPPRPPQSLAQMHDFNPGEDAGPDVVLPVSGSNLGEGNKGHGSFGPAHD